MTNTYEKEITHLKEKIEKLERLLSTEVTRLEKRIKDGEEGFGYYADKHLTEHLRINDMLWPAYCKTHPGFVETLVAAEKITGKISDDGSDPQP